MRYDESPAFLALSQVWTAVVCISALVFCVLAIVFNPAEALELLVGGAGDFFGDFSDRTKRGLWN